MYTIENVLDKHTLEQSNKWAYRIGRKCAINRVEIGIPLLVVYPNYSYFGTSVITAIHDKEEYLEVHTQNSIYIFRKPLEDD